MPKNVPPRRILCAVDFTRPSTVAASYASKIAAALEAELILCHALPPVPDLDYLEGVMANGADWPGAEAVANRWHDDALRRLVSLAATLPLEDIQLKVEPGNASEVLLELAEELDVDAIYLGSHGRRGFRRAIIGSVAEKIVRWSTVPVTVVRWTGDGLD